MNRLNQSIVLLLSLLSFAGAAEFVPHAYWETPPEPWRLPVNEPLKDYIKSLPPATGELALSAKGAPQFVLDGKVSPTLITWEERTQLFHEDYLGTGIRTHVARIDTGFIRQQYWKGPGKYADTAVILQPLWDVLQADPDAYIILHIRVEPYWGWWDDHPDDVMCNEKGEPAVVTSHFSRFGGAAPDRSKKERLAWSFFSETWREESSETIRKVIQTVEESIPGKRVVAYLLAGGQDDQLYFWHPPNHVLSRSGDLWGDYSAPAQRAWKKWAQAQYTTIGKLNTAWGTTYADFSEVKPAPSKLLVGDQRFSDPRSDQIAIDWRQFLADGRSDLVSHYAKVARDASPRSRIIGVSGIGPTGARRDSNAVGKLLDCEDIDYLFTQVSYGKRYPGQLGGMNTILSSFALNGKVFLADGDHPTWLVEPKVSSVGTGIKLVPETRGHAKNIADLQTMWLRAMSRLWANNAGLAFHRHAAGHQYHDLGIRGLMRSIFQMAPEMVGASPQDEQAEVAVIFNEHSIHCIEKDPSLMASIWNCGAAGEFAASGVPYRMYYAKDLREGRLPKFKMVVFVNQLDFDEDMRAGIEQLKREGILLVFLQGSGYLQSYDDMEWVSNTIGMGMARMEQGALTNVQLSAEYDILKKQFSIPLADPEKRRFQHGRAPGQLAYYNTALTLDQEAGLQVLDPEADALAFYPGTHKVAAAIRDHGTFKTAFIGTYLLDRNIIHRLADIAGAWTLTLPDNVVEASPAFVMVHPLEVADTIDIQLKSPKQLIRYPDGKLKSPKADHHTLKLEKNKTYLFRLMD